MIKVYKKSGDCYRACLASLLHKSLDDVPVFTGPDHWIKYECWLGQNGLLSLLINNNTGTEFNCSFPCIAALKISCAHKDIAWHSVIWQNKSIIHDPTGIISEAATRIMRIMYWQILLPLNPVCRLTDLKEFKISFASSCGYRILEEYYD